MKIVVVSGGFDPIHSGHISLLREANELGDILIVGLNSDAWLTRKKGKPFMNFFERKTVLGAIQWVDAVWEFNDEDGSARDLLERVKSHYAAPIYESHEFIFANGGDRNESNNSEIDVPGYTFVYGVGGNLKMNSSSKLLKDWNG